MAARLLRPGRPHVLAAVVVAVALAGALLAVASGPGAAAPADGTTRQFGTSVQGRPLLVTALGAAPEAATRTVLVVGSVHGDEPAGGRVAAALAGRGAEVPAGGRLLLVADANPDGARRGTRQNARRVDLNRNSSTGWRRSRRGSRYYGGPKPFSEPEARALRDLLAAEQPDAVVWLHQPYGLVDRPERGSARLARAYARRVRLPLEELGAYRGSLSRWTNATIGPGRSFVAELRAGRPSPATVERHADAALALLAG